MSAKAPFVLKFKGNKSFSPFHNLSEGAQLTSLWSVVTKVSSFLEEVARLENLAWRLWYLHNATIDESSKRERNEFKKLSRVVGEGFDKEKGKGLASLPSPPELSRSTSDRLAHRVAEKSRRASRTGAERAQMQRGMGSFSLDKTIGVKPPSRRGSLPSGSAKPAGLKSKSRGSSPGPTGGGPSTLSRSSSGRGTEERSRSRTVDLKMTSASTHNQNQYHPYPPQPSRSSSSSSLSTAFAYMNPSGGDGQLDDSLGQFFPPNQSANQPAVSLLTHTQPPTFFQNASQTHASPATYAHPLEPPSASNSISLSTAQLFQLAHGHPPPQDITRSAPDPPAPPEASFEDILRGFTGSGVDTNASGLDFGNLGLDGWPADFGPTASSDPHPSQPSGQGPTGGTFDHLFAGSAGNGLGLGMTGVIEGASGRPDSSAGAMDFTSSALSSSASPEEQQQQMMAHLNANPTLRNDRVRSLSQQQEPFQAFGRDDGGGGGRSSFGSVGENRSANNLFPDLGERRGISSSRKSSSSSFTATTSPKKATGRTTSENVTEPSQSYDFLQPVMPSSSSGPFNHPAKRRRGSNGSSTTVNRGASPALAPLTTLNLNGGALWSPAAVSPASIRLPPSNVTSPWSSRVGSAVNTPALELVNGFEGMGGGILGAAGSLIMTPSGGQQDKADFAFAFGPAVADGQSGKAQGQSSGSSASKASHPYQPNPPNDGKGSNAAKQRNSSGSSTGSQSNASSSAQTSGTLTPYPAGFLPSFSPITSTSTALPSRSRSGSESQSARRASGLRTSAQQQDQSSVQLHHLAASTPNSPGRRNAGLPGHPQQQQHQQQQQQHPPRLSLQEQLERAGMVPPSQPNAPQATWAQQQSSQEDMSFDFDFGLGQFGANGGVAGADFSSGSGANGPIGGMDLSGGSFHTWNGS